MTDVTLTGVQLRSVENAQFKTGIFVGLVFAIVLAIIGTIIYSGGSAFVDLS